MQGIEQPRANPYQRMVVTGTTGSGKTTLARQLAQHLGIPLVELDALHWEPNWTEAPQDLFRERVAQAVSGDVWVVDGNYSAIRDIVWSRARTIVWLDYSLGVIMAQLARRTVRRVFTREELWNGNRERFRTQFLSRDSLFLWALQTYWRRRRDFPVLFRKAEYAHLAVVRLPDPEATSEWLGSFTRSVAPRPFTQT